MRSRAKPPASNSAASQCDATVTACAAPASVRSAVATGTRGAVLRAEALPRSVEWMVATSGRSAPAAMRRAAAPACHSWPWTTSTPRSRATVSPVATSRSASASTQRRKAE